MIDHAFPWSFIISRFQTLKNGTTWEIIQFIPVIVCCSSQQIPVNQWVILSIRSGAEIRYGLLPGHTTFHQKRSRNGIIWKTTLFIPATVCCWNLPKVVDCARFNQSSLLKVMICPCDAYKIVKSFWSFSRLPFETKNIFGLYKAGKIICVLAQIESMLMILLCLFFFYNGYREA